LLGAKLFAELERPNGDDMAARLANFGSKLGKMRVIKNWLSIGSYDGLRGLDWHVSRKRRLPRNGNVVGRWNMN
jgi:hypothetical protein